MILSKIKVDKISSSVYLSTWTAETCMLLLSYGSERNVPCIWNKL